ncbi:MAG: hypothetical protein U1F48_12815 [Burkholderiales bacterium]
MTEQFHCPNCRTVVPQDAAGCVACAASFEGPTSWKPQRLADLDAKAVGPGDLFVTSFGIAVLVAAALPFMTRILVAVTGGMYGPFFRHHSAALFIATAFAFTYVPFTLAAWAFLRRFKIIERTPPRFRSAGMLTFGCILILLYVTARTLAALIPGGGAGFVVAVFSPYVLWPARILLAAALLRLAYGFVRGSR